MAYTFCGWRPEITVWWNMVILFAGLHVLHLVAVFSGAQALSDAVNMSREQENLHRKSRNSARDLEQLYQNLQEPRLF